MFGDTPLGILLLDIILLSMGAILTPILFGIFSRLGKVSEKLSICVTSLADTNKTLATVVQELNDARVRDKDIEGRLKGLNEKVDSISK